MWLSRALAPPTACLLLALASGAVLLAAFAFQYLGGAQPCHLCLLERWPYAGLIALGLIGWRWRPRMMLGLACLVLLGSAALAGYHVGVEQGWFALPESCAAGGKAGSIEELQRMLTEAPPACDQIRFTLLGLSLASWNVVASLALAAFAATAVLGLGRRRAEDRLAAAEP
jgi:disulfide bond formation protein DsbB